MCLARTSVESLLRGSLLSCQAFSPDSEDRKVGTDEARVRSLPPAHRLTMLLWNSKRKLDAHRSTLVEPKKQKSSDGGFIVPRSNAGRAVANCLAGKNVVLTGVFPQLGGGQGLDLGKARARR